MTGSSILLTVAIAGFILSRYAKYKAKNILVTTDLPISEERIKELRLFVGQEVGLYQSDGEGDINIFLKEHGRPTELLGSYTDDLTYKQLSSREVKAYIYAINGYLVTIEIKFYDSL